MANVSVTTDLMPDGVYYTVVHFGDDYSIPLPGDTALKYAYAIIALAQAAAHDAAVFNQWVFGMRLPDKALAAAMVLEDLQPDRPPVTGLPEPVAAVSQVKLSATTGRAKGYVTFTAPASVAGVSWNVESSWEHAHYVLGVRAMSELDTAYRSMARSKLGVSDLESEALVHDAGLWLETGRPVPTSVRLARTLREEQCPQELVDNARAGHYDDFKSELPVPEFQLYADLKKIGRDDLVERLIAGEWDATAEESQEWMKSDDARQAHEIVAKLFTEALKPGARRQERKGKAKRRRRR